MELRLANRTAPLVGALALACASGLPDYAAPTGRIILPSEYDGSDLVRYRTLTRADFRGTEPPGHVAAFRHRLGAATCAYLRTRGDTQLVAEPVEGRGGIAYQATPRRLSFAAFMDRKCSWWNDAQRQIPPAYVLEHEQIHFALFELQARRLNARSAQIERRIRGTGRTPERALAEAERMLERELALALETALARNREFDEDTSLGYRPERQRAWWSQVRAELVE